MKLITLVPRINVGNSKGCEQVNKKIADAQNLKKVNSMSEQKNTEK